MLFIHILELPYFNHRFRFDGGNAVRTHRDKPFRIRIFSDTLSLSSCADMAVRIEISLVILITLPLTLVFLADWSYINYSFQPLQISYGTAIVVKYIKGHVDIIGLHTHISHYWSRVTSTIFSLACFTRFYFNTLPNPMAYCWIYFYETFLCTYLFELKKQWNIANLLIYI